MTKYWLQIVVIVCWAIQLALNYARHGQPLRGHYNFYAAAISVAIAAWCFYHIGFFRPGLADFQSL